MIEHRLLRIAELCEFMAKELRAAAVELGWSPEHQKTDPRTSQISARTDTGSKEPRPNSKVGRRYRKEDTLYRLAEFGYIYEGTTIRPISRLIPKTASVDDPLYRAQIGRIPSKPIWLSTVQPMRSLTELSKTLRDEHGIPFPQSSFNPCKYWCIEGEEPERTLESIAQQLVL